MELAHKIRQAVNQRKIQEIVSNAERFRSDILTFLPDATFAIDTDGKVIVWNRAMERLTGVMAPAMLGKGNYEYAMAIYGERRPILLDLVLTNDPKVRAQYPFIRKDGTILSTEMPIPHLRHGKDAHFWFTASPLYDNHGTIIGAIESIRDMTDRKLAKDSLRREKEFFDAVMDAIPGAFFVLDREGRFIRANRFIVEALDTPAEEIRDTSALVFIVEEDRAGVEAEIARIFATGYGELRARVVGKRKIVRDYVFSARRITLGGEMFLVGTGTDVTGTDR